MFEDYIQDAYNFYLLGEEKSKAGIDRDAKMYFRASVFCAASAMEAFMNFIGDTFKKGGTLDQNEIAFINDKVLEFVPAKLKVQERIKFNPIDEKVKFVIKRFAVTIDLSSSTEWSNFLLFKDLRDSLIHPKDVSDEKSTADYKVSIKKGLNAIIELINIISQKVFSKPLRKGIAELKI